MTPSVADVERFLVDELGWSLDGAVEWVGAGQWSRCFGFVADGRDLVVRVGDHPNDFARDARAARFAGPGLPVPRTVDRGEGLGAHYAITERARGVALESVEDWEAITGPVAVLLEAMREVEPIEPGWGPWSDSETPIEASWRDFLLSVDRDPPGNRLHGWREKLRADPARARSFDRWYRELHAVAIDDVPRSLLHCDLVHGNVHVDVAATTITGVFDWGCSLYGDHLYELAQLEFWDPVLPNVRSDALRAALEDRWRADGTVVDRHDERMAAGHLHNGIVHLAYNAHLGDWHNFALVDDRLREVLAGFG